MYYLLSFGIILLGVVGLFASIFKYTKDEHKKKNFRIYGQGFLRTFISSIINLIPWWLAKIFLVLACILAIFIGVMIIITM